MAIDTGTGGETKHFGVIAAPSVFASRLCAGVYSFHGLPGFQSQFVGGGNHWPSMAGESRLRERSEGERIISNVVMMGMGEPLTNFDNVVTALHIMLDDHAYGLSRRRVTVSTSGVVSAMDRLGEACPVALAVSLHAPNDRLRDVLVPINKKYPLRELMASCQRYLVVAPRDFITFEYVILDGVNDSVAQARELIALTRDVPCKFNLIPFNPFPQAGYARSKPEAIRRFREILQEAGHVVTTRKTRGDDIDAACGQLAGKVQDKTKRTQRIKEVALWRIALIAVGMWFTFSAFAAPTVPGLPPGYVPSTERNKLTLSGRGCTLIWVRSTMQPGISALDEFNIAATIERHMFLRITLGLVHMELKDDAQAEHFKRALDLDSNNLKRVTITAGFFASVARLVNRSHNSWRH